MSSTAKTKFKELCDSLYSFSLIKDNKEREQKLLLYINNEYSDSLPLASIILSIYDHLKDHKVEIGYPLVDHIRYIFKPDTYTIIISIYHRYIINVENIYDLICLLLMFGQPQTNKLASGLYIRYVCQFREVLEKKELFYKKFFEFLIEYDCLLNLENHLHLYPTSICGKIKDDDFFSILNNASYCILEKYAKLKKHIPIIVRWMNEKGIEINDSEDEEE